MLNRTQLFSNIEALEKQGASQKEVQDYINSVKLEQPQEQVGGFKSVVRSIASPFLKTFETGKNIVSGGLNIAQSLALKMQGKDEEAMAVLQKQKEDVEKQKLGSSYGYFGNVKPLGSVKEGAAAGLEMASWLIPGSTVVKAAKPGFWGQGAKLLKEFGITGAVSGGMMNFGSAMQEAEASPMDVAYSTLFGTVAGGVGGVALGGLSNIAVKGTNVLRKTRSIQELEESLAAGYKKIFNPTARQVKIDTRFGGDSFKFMAQEMPDAPINVNNEGRIVADETIEMAKAKYQAEASAFKPIIKNSGKYTDLDNVINEAVNAAKKEFDATDLVNAENQIVKEIEAYVRNQPGSVIVGPNGRRLIALDRADDIKTYSWSRAKGWATPEAEVWSDTNNIIGHAFKEAIEKELDYAPIKEMNQRLGKWQNLITMLERRNAMVSGSGGKLSKYIIRSVGTSIGAGVGGRGEDSGAISSVAGAGAGYITAEALAALFSNPKVKLFILRQLIKRLQKEGQGDLVKEAQRILNEQALKYRLPARGMTSYKEPTAKAIPVYPRAGGQIDYIGKGDVIIPQSRLSSSATAQPINAPKNTDKKVIPQSNIEANKKQTNDLKKSFAGIAGIEITKDENGKTVIKFNPEKAIMGVVGMTAYNKISPSIIKKTKEKLTETIKDLISKEIANLDTLPIKTNKGLVFGKDGLFTLDQLKTKVSKKALSNEDLIKAIPLLKEQGIDVVKESVENQIKANKSKLTDIWNKAHGK